MTYSLLFLSELEACSQIESRHCMAHMGLRTD